MKRLKKPLELDKIDLEKIAEDIKSGCEQGWLDNGEGKHIYWVLNKNIWYDNQKESLTEIKT